MAGLAMRHDRMALGLATLGILKLNIPDEVSFSSSNKTYEEGG